METTIQELWFAYRRAKADSQRDRLLNQATAFARYERDLNRNLRRVNRRLRAGLSPVDTAGTVECTPKRTFEAPSNASVVFSDPDIEWDHSNSQPTEYRQHIRPSTDLAILVSLWMMRVGARLDETLSKHCYGNRLHRIDNAALKSDVGHYVSFKHYANQYKKWRENTLNAARQTIKQSHSAIIITLDIRNFYPSIDADELLKAVSLAVPREQELSGHLFAAIKAFNLEHNTRGLPIGLGASSVLANWCLATLDESISAKPNTDIMHYGRYVDDLAFVLRASQFDEKGPLATIQKNAQGTIRNPADQSEWCRIWLSRTNQEVVVGNKKTKVIRLAAESGLAMISAIRRESRLTASEWRFLPTGIGTRSSSIARLITTTRSTADFAKLRTTDSASMRRLSFSIALKQIDQLTKHVTRSDTTDHVTRFVRTTAQFAVSAIHAPEFLPYWPRILQVALRATSSDALDYFVQRLSQTLKRLKASSSALDYSRMILHIAAQLTNAIHGEAASEHINGRPTNLHHAAAVQIGMTLESRIPVPVAIDGHQLVWSDLATQSLVDLLIRSPLRPLGRAEPIGRLRIPETNRSFDQFVAVISNRHGVDDVELAKRMLLATRPPRYDDVRRVLGSVPDDTVNSVLELTRGPSGIFPFKAKREGKPVSVALTSMAVSKGEFEAALRGTPDLSLSRFERIASTIATVMKWPTRVDIAVLPEVAVPQEWAALLEDTLGREGISIVAGLEYSHVSANVVQNQASICIAERTNSGFARWSPTHQPKSQPAIGELLEIEGAKSTHLDATMPSRVYTLPKSNTKIGVVICSELSDIETRAKMRGKVEILVAVEYNPDTKLFAALVDSAAWDLHCFVIQCNNRQFGDSRIRSPARDDFRRDVVALKGGDNDQVVFATLDVMKLRTFQATDRRRQVAKPDENQHPQPFFKPVPDGFQR